MKRHRKFEKYGARAVFTAALLCFLLTWAACKGPENSGTDEESIPSETGSSVTEGTEAYSEETVTESAYSGPVPVIRAVSPEGEIDVVRYHLCSLDRLGGRPMLLCAAADAKVTCESHIPLV